MEDLCLLVNHHLSTSGWGVTLAVSHLWNIVRPMQHRQLLCVHSSGCLQTIDWDEVHMVTSVCNVQEQTRRQQTVCLRCHGLA